MIEAAGIIAHPADDAPAKAAKPLGMPKAPAPERIIRNIGEYLDDQTQQQRFAKLLDAAPTYKIFCQVEHLIRHGRCSSHVSDARVERHQRLL